MEISTGKSIEKKYSHIELFAGCGGMGLGLEAAGFDLYFANELSPMAGETFAYNLLRENLDELKKNKQEASKTLWINSKYPKNDLQNRLRENPFEAKKGKYQDLEANTDLQGKLLVGDIDNLLHWLGNNPKTVEQIRKKNITLLSGGPPCQSFSLAGKREKNNAKNLLPLSFAGFAGLIKPKFVLLENVKGITAPFTEDGVKHYAWFEVSKAFALEGYVPICMMLNSKYFGVAQNRPRFILLAMRLDIANKLAKKHPNKQLSEALKFYEIVQEKGEGNDLDSIPYESLNYYDIETNPDLYNGFLFPAITTPEGQFISASEAIGDLKSAYIYGYKKSRIVYRDYLHSIFNNPKEIDSHNSHELRKHSYEVMARFRFYQAISEFLNGNRKTANDIITGKEVTDEARKKVYTELLNYDLYFRNEHGEGYYKKPRNIEEVDSLVKTIITKKHSQRALREDEPAPAQLTIPDDICHYDMSQLRTLTVREMARFQSFPDWYVFRSKMTTGGTQRSFEVPQYTQVGNAVPPLLAKALGETIRTILTKIGD